MSRFYVGQRVKGISPSCLGITGVVVGFDVSWADCDMCVKVDQPGVDELGESFVPGEIIDGRLDEWTPIVPDGHKPAEMTVEELLPFLRPVRESAT